jgi:hypothetical protein
MWRKLVQRYAIRAREFSDSVAALGRQVHFGPKASRDLLEEIRTRRDLCNEVANEIEAVAMFARHTGMISADEYRRLRDNAKEARQRAEVTRIAFEEHIDSHHCGSAD